MAHPDVGYIPPEEINPWDRDPNVKWDDWMLDPETSEGFFLNDPYGPYRIALVKLHMEDQKGVARPDREKRLRQLERLREAAVNGRVAAEIDESDD